MKWLILGLFFLLTTPFKSLCYEEEISAAHLIAYQIKKGLENCDNKHISALISGIEAREKGTLLSQDELHTHSLYIEKRREFLAQKNLYEAEAWMTHLQSDKNVRSIIPLKLAYFLIKRGNGAVLTRECGKVSVNYTIKKIGDHFPETVGKEKELELGQILPGLAHGMLAMHEGEIRTIYIHPELAYQTNNFDPNVVLEATVELLQILPSHLAFPSLCEIPHLKSPEITPDELDRLELTDYYVLGWKLWDHLRWGNTLFTKEELISFLKQEPLKHDHLELDEKLNKIHWEIYLFNE